MADDNKLQSSKKNSPDWFVSGILTKLGETFDRLTGRNWQPSSSLATSELSEKLKKLLDAEVKDLGAKGQFVPHNIKLKMQWDKFSTDSEKAVEMLKNELHIAVIDHINDKRYYTYAPINIEIKPDYFTEGVKLLASFDKFDDEERERRLPQRWPLPVRLQGDRGRLPQEARGRIRRGGDRARDFQALHRGHGYEGLGDHAQRGRCAATWSPLEQEHTGQSSQKLGLRRLRGFQPDRQRTQGATRSGLDPHACARANNF